MILLFTSFTVNKPKSERYLLLKEFTIEDMYQEETFVFTKDNQYIIGTNSDDVFIYFHKQVNTKKNKSMGLKYIANGKAILFTCTETEVYHLKIRVVSNRDKKEPYKVKIHYVRH
jgi:hypothetical protein